MHGLKWPIHEFHTHRTITALVVEGLSSVTQDNEARAVVTTVGSGQYYFEARYV